MTQDIRGIDVKVMFADGQTAEGHISPIGTHIARGNTEARLPHVLETLNEAIKGRMKPYGEH